MHTHTGTYTRTNRINTKTYRVYPWGSRLTFLLGQRFHVPSVCIYMCMRGHAHVWASYGQGINFVNAKQLRRKIYFRTCSLSNTHIHT